MVQKDSSSLRQSSSSKLSIDDTLDIKLRADTDFATVIIKLRDDPCVGIAPVNKVEDDDGDAVASSLKRLKDALLEECPCRFIVTSFLRKSIVDLLEEEGFFNSSLIQFKDPALRISCLCLRCN